MFDWGIAQCDGNKVKGGGKLGHSEGGIGKEGKQEKEHTSGRRSVLAEKKELARLGNVKRNAQSD